MQCYAASKRIYARPGSSEASKLAPEFDDVGGGTSALRIAGGAHVLAKSLSLAASALAHTDDDSVHTAQAKNNSRQASHLFFKKKLSQKPFFLHGESIHCGGGGGGEVDRSSLKVLIGVREWGLPTYLKVSNPRRPPLITFRQLPGESDLHLEQKRPASDPEIAEK